MTEKLPLLAKPEVFTWKSEESTENPELWDVKPEKTQFSLFWCQFLILNCFAIKKPLAENFFCKKLGLLCGVETDSVLLFYGASKHSSTWGTQSKPLLAMTCEPHEVDPRFLTLAQHNLSLLSFYIHPREMPVVSSVWPKALYKIL